MAQLKTQPTKASVAVYLNAIEDAGKRRDCKFLAKTMRAVTGKKPVLWGSSIVGFGSYHYKYASGREGDWPVVAFSPRQRNISVYIMPGFKRYADLMKNLGKYKTGVSCLYVNSLVEINTDVLQTLVERAVADMREMYDCR